MHVVGLDHVVVNTPDVERAMHFYHEVLGLELLRLEEFRAGNVGFVSARISPETIIDIRPIAAGERVTPNMDHYCNVGLSTLIFSQNLGSYALLVKAA
jgi:catechol 2,3-dioxygenase-like lactoylglutathione lyase family enzyme